MMFSCFHEFILLYFPSRRFEGSKAQNVPIGAQTNANLIGLACVYRANPKQGTVISSRVSTCRHHFIEAKLPQSASIPSLYIL